ncbi:MAG: hypothetical protein V4629_11090 [Pseudomonadota bacterium]
MIRHILRNSCLGLLACTTLMSATTLYADATLSYTATNGSVAARSWISADKVKMEDLEKKTSVIYDLKKDEIAIVDHNTKEYRLMTKTDREALKQKLGGVMSQLESQLSQLPPEQRAMMESMMGNTVQSLQPKVTNTQQKLKVGKYDCSVTRIEISNSKTELCLAPISAVGIKPNDYESLQRIQSEIAEIASVLKPGALNSLNDIEGVPVRIISEDGVRDLQSFSEASIAPDVFVIPAEYKQGEPLFPAQ